MPETTQVFGRKSEDVQKIGKVLVEGLKQRKDKDVKVQEMLAMATEDLNLAGQTSLYTTAVAAFVEKLLRPKLVAAGVVKQINDFQMKGFNSVKVPLRSALITAAALPDNGAVSYDGGTYNQQTITLAWVYAANRISHALLETAAVDLISAELGEIGYAIAKKVDSDIIAAIDAAVTNGNSNRAFLGASTVISYGAIVDAYTSAMANYAEPNVILTNPVTFGTIMKLSEVKTAAAYAVPSNDTGKFMPMLAGLLNLQVIATPQCGSNKTYLIETERTGYLVMGSPVQTFDGRISGALAYEIIGAQAYGVAIVQPKSIYGICENTAS